MTASTTTGVRRTSAASTACRACRCRHRSPHKEPPMGLLSALLGNASEADVEDVERTLEEILADDERVERAFRLVRDLLIFTNHRFILVDRQGMTGKKT